MPFTPSLRFNLAVGFASAALVAAGCLYSPTVENVPSRGYPTPDNSGNVRVQFYVPTNPTPSSVTFTVTNPPAPAPSGLTQVDSGPHAAIEPYSVTIPTTALNPGLYNVEVTGDTSATLGHVNFIVPGNGATGSGTPSASPGTGAYRAAHP